MNFFYRYFYFIFNVPIIIYLRTKTITNYAKQMEPCVGQLSEDYQRQYKYPKFQNLV